MASVTEISLQLTFEFCFGVVVTIIFTNSHNQNSGSVEHSDWYMGLPNKKIYNYLLWGGRHD
ncbi:hypothetical protein, partial [Nostoc sp. UHCC 0251]|uniref:hypothetical protein n=1 Tax=Nostoc sp. UHCC 0251 TaxID=3110240 RepID=UPI002B212959